MSQKLEATAEIQSSADKFYGFFKNRMSDLVNIFPAGFKSAQVIEGHEGSVGAVLLYNFVAGKNKYLSIFIRENRERHNLNRYKRMFTI